MSMMIKLSLLLLAVAVTHCADAEIMKKNLLILNANDIEKSLSKHKQILTFFYTTDTW